MRGHSKMKRMRAGQTIVAERERAESESERMQARKKAHRKKTTSIIMALLVMAIIGLVCYIAIKEFSEQHGQAAQERVTEDVRVNAQIIDEDNRGQISVRTKEYIAQLEQDFQDLGYRVTKVILPTGTSRELYVDLDGLETYFKVNIDRGTAVSAEDAKRMIKYLEERDLHPEYVDVRVEGKAYYK